MLAFNPVHNRRTLEPGTESRWSKEVVTLFKNAATHEISNPFRAYLQQRRHFRNSEVFVHHSLVPSYRGASLGLRLLLAPGPAPLELALPFGWLLALRSFSFILLFMALSNGAISSRMIARRSSSIIV